MGGKIERSGIIGTIIIDDKDTISVPELTQIDSMFVVVDTQHVGIEPYLTSTQRRMTFLLQGDILHVELRQHIASRSTRFDSQFRKVLANLQFLKMQLRLEYHANHFGLSVGVRREVHDLRARFTLC